MDQPLHGTLLLSDQQAAAQKKGFRDIPTEITTLYPGKGLANIKCLRHGDFEELFLGPEISDNKSNIDTCFSCYIP